jgi:hypothetical protein
MSGGQSIVAPGNRSSSTASAPAVENGVREGPGDREHDGRHGGGSGLDGLRHVAILELTAIADLPRQTWLPPL